MGSIFENEIKPVEYPSAKTTAPAVFSHNPYSWVGIDKTGLTAETEPSAKNSRDVGTPPQAVDGVSTEVPNGHFHGGHLCAHWVARRVTFVTWLALLEGTQPSPVPDATHHRDRSVENPLCVVQGKTRNGINDERSNCIATAIASKFAGVELIMYDRMMKKLRRKNAPEILIPKGTAVLHVRSQADAEKLRELHDGVLEDVGGVWVETAEGRGVLREYVAGLPDGYVSEEAARLGLAEYPLQGTMTFQKPQPKEEKQ